MFDCLLWHFNLMRVLPNVMMGNCSYSLLHECKANHEMDAHFAFPAPSSIGHRKKIAQFKTIKINANLYWTRACSISGVIWEQMVPNYYDIMRWSRWWLMQNATTAMFQLRNWLLQHALIIHLAISWKWYRYSTDEYVLRYDMAWLICIISISVQRLNTFIYRRIFSLPCCISW